MTEEKAGMYTAIRDFFAALTVLTKKATDSLDIEIERQKKDR